ncbi:hypothetical protein [Gloeothece verrucosa]|uniref:Uncharacterized protein n=1 Tax=Gloeothece verrucosa (strain PCC 7822) TaxID=497965 RepID=E0U611_GLOV7|nr:hypothetical protein [Gloeothece verrucosa]ADN17120.1 conserved hypothetical protein [Gloeothece verrucosa PCC 7822]
MVQTPATSVRQANLFELSNDCVQIVYSTTSFSGRPQLNYLNKDQKFNFQGDEIRVQETEIGSLVTVTLETIPDLLTRTLSLLVPLVNLRGEDLQTLIQTIAIETVSRTTIGGPDLVDGAVQTYETIFLKGQARFVVF